jgi:hypothetical protein
MQRPRMVYRMQTINPDFRRVRLCASADAVLLVDSDDDSGPVRIRFKSSGSSTSVMRAPLLPHQCVPSSLCTRSKCRASQPVCVVPVQPHPRASAVRVAISILTGIFRRFERSLLY